MTEYRLTECLECCIEIALIQKLASLKWSTNSCTVFQ